MATREELQVAVVKAQAALNDANAALEGFNDLIDNHTYLTLDEAIFGVEDYLRDKAHEDCKGSYNCGLDEYVLDFKVEDVVYTGTLACEYNRHDKTYYYVDETDFTYKVKD